MMQQVLLSQLQFDDNNFRSRIQEHAIYIDKTPLLRELLLHWGSISNHQQGSIHLLTDVEHSGKTLFLSTAAAYLQREDTDLFSFSCLKNFTPSSSLPTTCLLCSRSNALSSHASIYETFAELLLLLNQVTLPTIILIDQFFEPLEKLLSFATLPLSQALSLLQEMDLIAERILSLAQRGCHLLFTSRLSLDQVLCRVGSLPPHLLLIEKKKELFEPLKRVCTLSQEELTGFLYPFMAYIENNSDYPVLLPEICQELFPPMQNDLFPLFPVLLRLQDAIQTLPIGKADLTRFPKYSLRNT